MPTEKRLEKIKKVLRLRQTDLTVVIENIHDPHNVSAICRTCDAVGISDVYLLYTMEPFPKLGRKSSASAKKWLEFHRYKNYSEIQNRLQREGKKIYATHVDSSARSIYDIDWSLPSAVITGNEHRGVSQDALNIADQKISIPMMGMVESLNVSVAAAVILYEALRQRQKAQKYNNLPDELWYRTQLEKWTGSEKSH